MMVGVGRYEMPIPAGLEMWGYTPRPNEGVLDPLYARIFVFRHGADAVALVTLDLGRTFGISQLERVRQRVRASAQVDDVIFIASHTHSGPYLRDVYPEGQAPAWELEVVDGIAAAIEAAVESEAPARLALGRGRVEIGHNRRFVRADGTVKMLWANPTRVSTHPVDPEVLALRIDGVDGQLRAILVGYACHPVVFGPDNLRYSADFPGAMARRVHERLGVDVVVGFLQGAAGDINPFMDKRELAADAVRLKDEVGEALGDEVVRAVERARSAASKPSIRLRRERMTFRSRLQSADESFEGDLTVLLLNDSYAFVGIPGEPFVEFQLDLKRRMNFEASFLMGYTNGYLRYFPTIRAASEGGYGADRGVAVVEVGAGERMMMRAYVQLFEMIGALDDRPAGASARRASTAVVSADRPPDVWQAEPVSLSLRDADLAEVLRSFARLGRFNLVLHPAVRGRVTVELRDVPWDQALRVILKTHGLGLEVSGGVYSIAPPTSPLVSPAP